MEKLRLTEEQEDILWEAVDTVVFFDKEFEVPTDFPQAFEHHYTYSKKGNSRNFVFSNIVFSNPGNRVRSPDPRAIRTNPPHAPTIKTSGLNHHVTFENCEFKDVSIVLVSWVEFLFNNCIFVNFFAKKQNLDIFSKSKTKKTPDLILMKNAVVTNFKDSNGNTVVTQNAITNLKLSCDDEGFVAYGLTIHDCDYSKEGNVLHLSSAHNQVVFIVRSRIHSLYSHSSKDESKFHFIELSDARFSKSSFSGAGSFDWEEMRIRGNLVLHEEPWRNKPLLSQLRQKADDKKDKILSNILYALEVEAYRKDAWEDRKNSVTAKGIFSDCLILFISYFLSKNRTDILRPISLYGAFFITFFALSFYLEKPSLLFILIPGGIFSNGFSGILSCSNQWGILAFLVLQVMISILVYEIVVTARRFVRS